MNINTVERIIINNTMLCCANCGKGEDESFHLKECTACKLVKYCNRDCQIAHRPQHKKACKKRAAELHDEKLFRQPPPREDCPICMLPLPTIGSGYVYKTCCGKIICSGCFHAVAIRDSGVGLCPFCRTQTPTPEEAVEQYEKRMAVDDAEAIYNMGCDYYIGSHGLPQDGAKAFELWHRAADLGHAEACFNIGNSYYHGNGVERDTKKGKHYFELAAMGGDAIARHSLGALECNAGNFDKALKHFMISVGAGYELSLDTIRRIFIKGHATKDDYAKALQSYQAYLDEIKSPQRDEAAAASDRFKYYK